MTVDMQDLILSIAPSPSVTAKRWANLSDGAPECFNETFLFNLYSHHVGTIAYEATVELGWDSMLGPFLFTVLSRMGGLSEAVWNTHYAALRELSQAAPELISQNLVVKGALLGLLYPAKRHRVMGDFDLIAPGDVLTPTLDLLKLHGYDRRSDMAYDMLKQVGPLYTGAGLAAMHIWEMPARWSPHIRKGKVGEIDCMVPTPELHLVELLTNAHEHSASWYYALWESDLQYVRVLDVDLICEKHPVDPARLWETAIDVGLEAEVGLGLWVHEQLSGRLPPGWEVLRPILQAVAPFGNLYALPISVDADNLVRQWPLSVRDRAFHSSRHSFAIELLPEHQQTTEFIHMMKNALVSHEQPVQDIATLARHAVSNIHITRSG